MVLQIFRPPGEGEALASCKLGDINDAISLEYEKYFCGVGTFTLEIPSTSPFAGVIAPNVMIYDKQFDDCFIVRNVKDDTRKMTVTGYDLNGLLRDRIILGNEGAQVSENHVCVSGSTEYCVKYFVSENMINADDNNRNYPRLAVADDNSRGLADAHGYAAPEILEDVVRALCEDAGLGYRLRLAAEETSSADPLLIFDVAERVDRTAGQDERNRVIFSVGLENVASLVREVGITAHKNALWCETGGEPVFRHEGGKAAASWNRREEYVSLAVTDSTSAEEISEAANQTFADKFAVTDSLTLEAGNPLDYGAVYTLGDMVTVYDKRKSVQLDTWISAVRFTRRGGEFAVKIILGEAKPKLLDGYAKQSDLLKKYQKDYPAAQISKLPIATTTVLGCVIVGDGLSVDEYGVLSCAGGTGDTKFGAVAAASSVTIADVIFGGVNDG